MKPTIGPAPSQQDTDLVEPVTPPVLASTSERPRHGVTWGEAFRVWSRIAALSFGGPAGQIAVMHRILVEEKRWISESRFLHALNYCMLLPGPEAQQLATYIGWLMHRVPGGLLAGGLFILPGIAAIMALSWIYALYGNVGVVAGLFFGLKAAVLAIVLDAVVRISRRALKNALLVAISVGAFAAIFAFNVPFPLIVLGAGIIGFIGGRSGSRFFLSGAPEPETAGEAPPLLGEGIESRGPSWREALRVAGIWLLLWLVPVATLIVVLGSDNVFSQIAVFFSKMAMVTFGGAYAALAYVAQQAVEQYGWLKPGEMLDGLGMAETTPGPLIMVLQFVGFLAAFRDPGQLSPLMAGTLGGLLATWVTFTPCFLWIFLGAPYIERIRGNRALGGALSAITAAVVGVILNLAIWFFIHTIFAQVSSVSVGILRFDVPLLTSINVPALMLSAAAIIAMFRYKLGILATLALCSPIGMALYFFGAIGPS
ncbi:chromate efflux transporter [Microvirga brassicacearum]|uniref:Chromate efflux transporter n=1 Tax=Microvirga brassicacearum TaxID=2580413 RepID=A0A5N3PC81_9HYPH|nr:chromate efflux transporter [Microvirga brassicacearum]KAB0267329.1 chromate efflux transporter [Microvirga brassicacearum]